MRRDLINTLTKTNLNDILEIRESGLYDITNKALTYNNVPLSDLLHNNLSNSEVYLEVINTGELSIQIIHTSTFEMRRSGIKQGYTWKWSDWGKTYAVTKEKIDSISNEKPDVDSWNYNEVKEALREYVKQIKGASYIDIDKGKQPAYNDIEVRAKINDLVDRSRRTEIVPHNAQQMESDIRDGYWQQSENLTPPNRDFLYTNRLETFDNTFIVSKYIVAYTFNGNPFDRWAIMRAENNDVHYLGHDRFDRVYFEGHYRPRVIASDGGRFAGNDFTRGNCFMIQEDLNWKWVYNGGRVGYVNVSPTVCNEIYYKGTPDFGVGWPSSYTGTGTHGVPQNGGDWTRWNFWDNTHTGFGVWGQNIENVLYR